MCDVVRVAGHDRVAVLDEKRNRRIGYVAGSGMGKQETAITSGGRIERALQETHKRASESRLTGWIAPRLGHAGGRRHHLDAGLGSHGE